MHRPMWAGVGAAAPPEKPHYLDFFYEPQKRKKKKVPKNAVILKSEFSFLLVSWQV